MKVNNSVRIVVLLLVIINIFMMAFSPIARPGLQDIPPTVLDVILKIAMGFASLAGVSSLVAVLVQIFKLIGLAKNNTAPKWTAAFNLLAFIALVYFGVFQPQLALSLLDGYAAQIAEIALFVLGFIVQMTISKPTYNALKSACVPLLGYSYSNA